VNFRIRKGTHFHEKCPRWPTENYYEQEKPLWWGNPCEECSKLADIDAAREEEPQSRMHFSRKAGTGC
jgi:hypothetical protein